MKSLQARPSFQVLLGLLAALGLSLLTACGGGGGGGGGAPTGVSYSTSPATYSACVAITPNTPTVTGGAATSFSIAPALPAGLTFSTITGVISGTPTAAAVGAGYTITATNAAGSANVLLTITVNSSAPSGLSYADAAPTYRVGFPITPNVTTLASGAASSYAVTAGTLPTGIELDTVTGTLSGTPLLTQSAAAVTITASGCAGGSAVAVVTIGVTSPSTRGAYVCNQSENTVSFFVQVAATGQLWHNGYLFTGTDTAPRAVTTNPSGTFAFVAMNNSSTIQSYVINPANGRLTVSGTAVTSTANPIALGMDPLGRYLYAANSSGTVTSYTIGSGTGQLTPTSAPSVTAGTSPAAIAVDPLARFVYVVNTGSDDAHGYSINPANGNLTALAGSPFPVGDDPLGVAIDPTGGFLYCVNFGAVDSVSAYSINATTGALTELTGLGSPYATGVDPVAIAITADGAAAYVSNVGGASISVFSRNTGTGALTSSGPTATGTAPVAVAADLSGAFLYSLNLGDAELRSYSIGGGAALTAVAPFETRTRAQPRAIAFAPGLSSATFTTDAVYAANQLDADVNQFTADATTGALTSLAPAQVGSLPTPNWATVHPTLDVLYVTLFNTAGTSIQRFSLDASGVATAAANHGTVSVNFATLIEPSGRFAYLTGGAIPGRVTPYSIDAVTGALTAGTDAAAGDQPRGGAVHPNGKFLYVANQFSGNVSQYSIDASTGALTVVGTINAGSAAQSVAVDPTGRLAYVACSGVTGVADGTLAMFSIHPTTGALTALASAAPAGWSDTFDVAVHPNGRFLYVADQLPQTITQYLINTNPINATEDGALFFLATTSVAQPVRHIRMNAAGTALYAACESDASVPAQLLLTYGVDASTGGLTLIDTDATGARTRGIGSRDRVE
ncbi:MAG: hypothetical protein FJ299_06815 [Planctomycetes bacterium]|nr:hypothetical protein [Planctomycetota bacterium]